MSGLDVVRSERTYIKYFPPPVITKIVNNPTTYQLQKIIEKCLVNIVSVIPILSGCILRYSIYLVFTTNNWFYPISPTFFTVDSDMTDIHYNQFECNFNCIDHTFKELKNITKAIIYYSCRESKKTTTFFFARMGSCMNSVHSASSLTTFLHI